MMHVRHKKGRILISVILCSMIGAVTVMANTAPTAASGQRFVCFRDTTGNYCPLAWNDPDSGQTHTITVVTPPAHGSYRPTYGGYYTPDAGYAGQDSMQWKISDGTAESETVTLTIDVREPSSRQGLVIEILVEDILYPEIQTQVERMKQDMENEGYTVMVSPCSETTAAGLKTYLFNRYNDAIGLHGAVLIGVVPLYVDPNSGNQNDLGLWEIYTGWSNAPDYSIWVSRIHSQISTTYGTEVEQIDRALKANHEYRTGISRLPHTAYYYHAWQFFADYYGRGEDLLMVWPELRATNEIPTGADNGAYAEAEFFPERTDIDEAGADAFVGGGEYFEENSHGTQDRYMYPKFRIQDLHRLSAQQRFFVMGSCTSGKAGGIGNNHIFTRGGGNIWTVGSTDTSYTGDYTLSEDNMPARLDEGAAWGLVLLKDYPFGGIYRTLFYGDLSTGVMPYPANQLPEITSFSKDKATVRAQDPVTFTVNWTDGDAGSANSPHVEWEHKIELFPVGYDYGKNAPVTTTVDGGGSASIAYTYTETGTYKVRVELVDEWMAHCWREMTVTVNPAYSNQAPRAVAVADPVSGDTATEFYFDASNSFDSDGSITAYEWREGSTLLSTAVDFLHTFATEGMHTIALTVWDDHGSTGTDSVNVNVTDASPVGSVTVVDWGGDYVSADQDMEDEIGMGSECIMDYDGDGVDDVCRRVPFDDLTARNPTNGYAGTSATFYGGCEAWEVNTGKYWWYDRLLARVSDNGASDFIQMQQSGNGAKPVFGAVLWKQEDFLNGADTGALTLGDGAAFRVYLDGGSGLDRLRILVKSGGDYYISDWSTSAENVLVELTGTELAGTMWAQYDPRANDPYNAGETSLRPNPGAHNTSESLTYNVPASSLTGITAVGVYFEAPVVDTNPGNGMMIRDFEAVLVGGSNSTPICWLPLDEMSGTTALDASGNGNDGTVHNGAVWTAGVEGNGLRFDGSDDALTVSALDGLATGNQPHTIAAWIKVNALPANRAWIALLGNSGPGSHHWLINNNGGTQFGVWGGPQCAPNLQVGVWTHVAMTFNGAVLRGFVNGTQIAERSATFDLRGAPLTIAQAYINENAFSGEIDDVRIYNHALTEQQIADVIAGITPPAPDTQAPSVPGNVTATAVSSNAVDLSWDASADNVGVSGYDIKRDGALLTTVTGTSYSDSGLMPATTYSYTIEAFDAAGNRSGESSVAQATTHSSPGGGSVTVVDWGGDYVSAIQDMEDEIGMGSECIMDYEGDGADDVCRRVPFDDVTARSPTNGYAGTSATFYGGCEAWEVNTGKYWWYDRLLARVSDNGASDFIQMQQSGNGAKPVFGAVLWKQEDFLNGADTGALTLGDGAAFRVYLDGGSGLDRLRILVRSGGQYYLSDWSTSAENTLVELTGTELAGTMWAQYDPRANDPYNAGETSLRPNPGAHNTSQSLTYNVPASSLTGITAVGVYFEAPVVDTNPGNGMMIRDFEAVLKE